MPWLRALRVCLFCSRPASHLRLDWTARSRAVAADGRDLVSASLVRRRVLDRIVLTSRSVQLLAHEFLFNKDMLRASNGKLAYALGCMVAGAGIMALLGRWA